MKGKIDNKGRLSIWRGNRWCEQYCPFAGTGEVAVECSHLCPLFGEPINDPGYTMLVICQERALIFDEFIDGREQEVGDE